MTPTQIEKKAQSGRIVEQNSQHVHVHVHPSLEVLKHFCVLNSNKNEIYDVVGILIYITMLNTPSASYKPRKVFTFQHFSFCELLKFHAQLCLA